MTPQLHFHPDVKTALVNHQPVVALESTIITHGLPYPENLQTARMIEAMVKDNGAVPASIAIINGQMKIGLSDEELCYLADPNTDVTKVSRRDIAHIIAGKKNGATTVAGTMILAAMAGIPIFATGGIGGVHKGADQTFDISADLPELANSNVAVVSAGPKAILDLPLTMEYLETHGVPVIGYGTDELPAFWSRRSGIKLGMRADTATDIASIMKTKWDLGLKGGMLIANPVPEDKEIPAEDLQKVIDDALDMARAQNITGKQTTPFLLDLIRQKTNGDSLITNQALILHNAAIAAKIAIAYCELKKA
ncbi:MAG: pseudouridine-5'-phosphate glycosidase [Candidatus Puniceispirillaceae bacterium]